MSAKIVFSGGASITVTEDTSKVIDELGKGVPRPFVRLTGQGVGDVYVASNQVAYVQAIGEGRSVYK
jgi:hypothetical protein